MASGRIATLCKDVLIFNFIKNRIMEILIYFYIAFSYLVMIGYANGIKENGDWSVKDKAQTCGLIIVLLLSPLVVPYIVGGLLYKLMKY